MHFKRLPYNVCLRIFSQIPIEDVTRFQKVCQSAHGYSDAREACSEVRDPVKYLDKIFGRGAQLIRAMAKSNAYLSGSRALDYFVPGSADADSDWDFYVSYDLSAVYQFMMALEELGVTWTNNSNVIDEVMVTPGNHATIALWTYEGEAAGIAARLMELFQSRPRPLPLELMMDGWSGGAVGSMNFVKIENLGSKIRMTSVSHDAQDDYEHANDIVRGTYEWRGRRYAVQLIITRTSFIETYRFLEKYHSSCVQCFICPVAAVHLYGKLAAKHQSCLWLHDTPTDVKDIVPMSKDARIMGPSDAFVSKFKYWAKYKRRGFEFHVPAPTRPHVLLSLTSGGNSTVIPIRSINVPEHVGAWYTTMLNTMYWIISNDGLLIQRPEKMPEAVFSIRDTDWFETFPSGVSREYFQRILGHTFNHFQWNRNYFSRAPTSRALVVFEESNGRPVMRGNRLFTEGQGDVWY